jgi:hypothetical protein
MTHPVELDGVLACRLDGRPLVLAGLAHLVLPTKLADMLGVMTERRETAAVAVGLEDKVLEDQAGCLTV